MSATPLADGAEKREISLAELFANPQVCADNAHGREARDFDGGRNCPAAVSEAWSIG